MKKRMVHVLYFLLTVLLWFVAFETGKIHDRSLQDIHDLAFVFAGLWSMAWLWIIYDAIADRFRHRSTPEPISDPWAPDDAPQFQAGANPREDATARDTRRYNSFVGGAGVVALFAYFPIARYIQILTPGRFWAVVLGLSTAGGLVVYLAYMRPMLARIARRRDRISTILVPLLALIPCVAMAVRLLNSPVGLLQPPRLEQGQVVSRSAHTGHTINYGDLWTSYSLHVNLATHRSVSLAVSARSYGKLPVGTSVRVQTRAGLFGIPWCLGECVIPVQPATARSP